MKKPKLLIALAGILCGNIFFLHAQQKLPLAGEWHFKLDREDKGSDEQWYRQQLKDPVKLPGSMQAQGYGDKPSVRIKWIGERSELFLQQEKYAPYRSDENYKFPFWLTPVKYYTGAAWYQREVNIPANWKDKHITLTLERCHWSSTVFVDDQPAGADSSLATPHVYDLSALLTPGKHTLSIRVDNRYVVDVGENAHSASDQTQGTWNGIAGNIVLEAGDPVFIKQVQVLPDLSAKTATIKIWLGHTASQASAGKLTLRAQLPGKGTALPALTQNFSAEDSLVTLQYPMGNDPQLWDEFHHQLYQLSVQLQTDDNKYRDEHKLRFGMRSIRAQDDKIFVNGRPIFLRGTLECAIFPLTGYPPTDTASWGRIFRILQAHGLNHMRFHSWCPPEAAFTAADNAGIYLSVEVDAWARLGDGKPIDRYLYEESNRIVAAYGNHPSFCLLVPSNEPHGDKKRDAYLAAFVQYWQQKDSRRLYSAGSGWPLLTQNDYHITPDPRIQGWGEELKSVINAQPPNTLFDFKEKMKRLPAPGKPIVAHEIGQWCVYPDFTEIKKYTGLLQARNFEIFRDFMKKEQLLPQAHDFLMASGKLQALCYKADIEAGMRTNYAGYQLLDLHDFPGQGTALVGILDPFWNSKPYFTPAAFHRFSSATVPLALIPKFTWKNTETFTASVQVSHFGKDRLRQTPLRWRITGKDKRVLASGTLQADLDFRTDNPAGNISFDLSRIKTPEKLNLEISVGKLGVNDWDFWVYQDKVNTTTPAHLIVTATLTPQIQQQLENGAAVLLLLNGKIKSGKGKEIKTGMSTVFWNTEWTSGQGPHTLGILCKPSAPLFRSFPTEYYSNWQWWDLLHTAQPMDLHGFPASLTPSVQLIDTWFDARKLALLFEAQVGKGKIMVSSMDLTHDLEQRLAARQLYSSLLAYMEGKDFKPAVAVDIKDIQALYE
jgi:hypothetical protein